MPKRSLPALFLFASLGAAVGAAVLAPAPASAEDKKLKCGDLKYEQIKDACNGGADTENKMKKQMKKWQGDANDKGGDFKCSTCHESAQGGALKPGVDMDKMWGKFAKLAGIPD